MLNLGSHANASHARPTRRMSQPVSPRAPENPNPGTEGMTRASVRAAGVLQQSCPPCQPCPG
jgi:hypothetical protein